MRKQLTKIQIEVAPIPVKEYLEVEDTSLIEDAALCLRDKLLVRLLRRLGCRVGEILGLEERHIDFSQRQIKIVHEKARITRFCSYCAKEGVRTRLGKKWLACPRCMNPISNAIIKQMDATLLRKVPIDKDTLQLIRQYINQGGITEVREKQMLFTISRQWVWHIVVDCAERAGFLQLENPKNEKLHHVHPHSFRDAFVNNVMKQNPNDDDIRLLQEMLGHQNFNTTAAYRKVSGVELRARYDKWLKEEK